MNSIPNEFPLSLRAWPQNDDTATALTSLISRINAERSSFRNITEESLEKEIRQGESDIEAANGDGESDEEEIKEEPDRAKELATAREDILGQLEQAHNAAMVALDFVSLLLSKDTPIQASLSISQALQDTVALGTLGVDKVHDSRVTITQKDDNRRIAKGWKVQSLNQTVDSILASATRLENEVKSETKYWEQVLAINEKGWAVCRIPQEKHTLGVRFGFLEAAPAFRNRSLGALRRNADGTIELDQGITDHTPKRVRVRIQTDGLTTGETSRTAAVLDPSIEALILQARNTIFEEELWQELNREARLLANQGVRLIGERIVCPMASTKRVVLDLVPIEEPDASRRSINNDDNAADMISFSLRLLLSYAHRQNLRRRSQRPAPISNRPTLHPPYALLRPILSRLHHQSVISVLTALLSSLSKILASAGIIDVTHTVNSTPVTLPSIISKPVPEQTIETLISNLSAEFTIPLSTKFDQSLSLRLRTIISPLETHFQITASGILASICKPPQNPSSIDEVRIYILWAVACALAASFANLGSENSDDASVQGQEMDVKVSSSLSSGLHGWQRTHNPTALRKSFKNEKDSKELSFSAVGKGSSVEIIAMYKHVIADTPQDKGVTRYIWKAEGSDTEIKTISQVVDEVGKWPGPLRAEGEWGF